MLLLDLESDRFDQRMRLTETMLWKRVDGIIMLDIPMDAEEPALMDRLALPVVTVGNQAGGWPSGASLRPPRHGVGGRPRAGPRAP